MGFTETWTAGELGKFIFETMDAFKDHGLVGKRLEQAVGRAVFIRMRPLEEPAKERQHPSRKIPMAFNASEAKEKAGVKSPSFQRTKNKTS